MLYDLNIAWSPSTSASDLARTLKFSSSLGYNVVALNHTIAIAQLPTPVTNPLPKFPVTPDSHAQSREQQEQDKDNGLPTILHRATIPINDSSMNHLHRLAQLAPAYDILAVRPATEKTFSHACLNMAETSIISLDLAQQFDFFFKPRTCMAAVSRGVRFEICYAQVLGADARGRANFIGNLASLLRVTKGRGLVVSSEARGVMGLRGPADVVNLLAVWGLGTEKGMEGLGVNPRGIVVNEGIKRSGFRGIVDIVSVAERKQSEKMEGVEEGGGAEAKQKEKEKAGSGKTGKNANVGQKRKGEDGGAQQGEVPLSKRKAKKIKKVAAVQGKSEGTDA